MSEMTEAGVGTGTANTSTNLGRAALAGVLAGLVFGLMIQFVLERMTAIGAMYTLGDPSLTVGWVAHFVHSGVFGLLFGVLTWWGAVGERTRSLPGSAAAGAGFGALLWFVNIGFIWPLWLNAVGVGSGLSVPYFAPRPLAGHVVWGLLLGALYWALTEN